MARTSGVVALATLVAVLLLAAGGVARAEDKIVNIVFTGTVEPSAVDAGGEGTLVLKGAIRKTAHVYTDPKRFTIRAEKSTGVTYFPPEVLTPPQDYADPEFPEDPPEKVWFDEVVVKVRFTLAADAPSPAKVGATLGWSACDEGNCYPPETTPGPVWVEVPRPGGTAKVAGTAPKTAEPVGAVPSDGNAPTSAPPPAVPAADGTGATPAADRKVFTYAGKAAKVTVTRRDDAALVRLEPAEGMHLYAPDGGKGDPIRVEGRGAEGVTWKAPKYDLAAEPEVHDPYEAEVAYAGAADAELRLFVHWQGCWESGLCDRPEERIFVWGRDGWRSEPTKADEPVPSAVTVGAGYFFPVVEDEAAVSGTVASEPPEEDESGWVALWRKLGILFLGPIFLLGIGLAFTPCVLPIIPITVSIIGGGRTDLSRGRLAFLLTCYSVGLSLTFGTMGLVAALTGGSLSAAFQSPVAIWVIAGIFLALSLGMFGIYELQPPAFLQRLQGGAKGGSVVGAFLFGAIAAVIASPCTGPALVAMLLFIAESGNAVLGFLMFFTLGLGMSSVFFAAGSLNLLARPGPWMQWVRWAFGVMLVGLAFYYLSHAEKLLPPLLFVVGAIVAVAVAWGVGRHLVRHEGEDPRGAWRKAALVAVLLCLTTGVVAWLTRPTDRAYWTEVESKEQLLAEVRRANESGRSVVVDVWATWCENCKKWDHVIEDTPEIRAKFDRLHRLRLNVTSDNRDALRAGLGIPTAAQPYLVFVDRRGYLRKGLDIKTWPGKSMAGTWLEERTKALGVVETASR